MAELGRPTIYSHDLVDAICERISSGESVRTICKDEKMPNASTIYEWLNDATKSYFSEQYAKARNKQADHLFEEILDIADDGTNDWIEREDPDNPGWQFNGEHYQRSRLRIDARKWYLSKVLPKKYGEKIDVDHTTNGKDIPAILGMRIQSDNGNSIQDTQSQAA